MKLNALRQEMIDEFIGCLKKEKIPWHQSWSGNSLPYNAVSGSKYHSTNLAWLSYVAQVKGYEDPRWCTFKQAAEKGWKVKKGEKGTKIEFWSMYDVVEKKKLNIKEYDEMARNLSPEELKERIKFISNTYAVFNGEQIDGIPMYEKKTYDLDEKKISDIKDVLIKNMNVKFREYGDSAYYSPGEDKINMPAINQFESEYAYMSTLLHEAGHATGHEDRLNRDMFGIFGSPEYAKEELRAEIASAFTAQTLGLSYEQNKHMENHEAYIQSWISVLENNPNELFAAIKDAENISDYLIEKGEFMEYLHEDRGYTHYEIMENSKEFSYKDRNKIKEGCTIYDGISSPFTIKTFDNIDDALNEIKNYKSGVRELKGAAGTYYDVTEYYIEENTYDADNEWIKGGDIHGISKMPRPDMTLEISDLIDYGYDFEGMYPVGRDRALELSREYEIYRIYPDGTEAVVTGNEIYNDGYEYMYGIEIRNWEKEKSKSETIEHNEKYSEYENQNDKLEKTVKNVQKCTSLSNSISTMEIVGKKQDVIKEIQKFAFTNGYEHMGKIIDKEFFGKPEKIKEWLLSIVNETKDEDMKDEVRTYITRLDKISPQFTNQVVSEKINNDPLFSISSRDFMEKRAESLQEKEDKILNEKNKKQKKQGFDDQRKYDYDVLEDKLLSNAREKTLKRQKERTEISR